MHIWSLKLLGVSCGSIGNMGPLACGASVQNMNSMLTQQGSQWRPDALKKHSGEGLKKAFKTCVILARLWGPNVVPNGAQNMYLFEVSGVPGPDWAHGALRVDSESQNGGSKCFPKWSSKYVFV